MASRMYDYYKEQNGTHKIGNLNSMWAKHIVNGVLATEDIENFTLVELYFEDGVRKAKQLTDVTKPGYLVTTVEEDQLYDGETYADFYNAEGEQIRVTYLEAPLRFETDNFELNTGVSAVEVGMVAHFDPTNKTYIVSDVGSPHVDYENAYDKFYVVDEDTEFGYAFDKTTVRFERQ